MIDDIGVSGIFNNIVLIRAARRCNVDLLKFRLGEHTSVATHFTDSNLTLKRGSFHLKGIPRLKIRFRVAYVCTEIFSVEMTIERIGLSNLGKLNLLCHRRSLASVNRIKRYAVFGKFKHVLCAESDLNRSDNVCD